MNKIDGICVSRAQALSPQLSADVVISEPIIVVTHGPNDMHVNMCNYYSDLGSEWFASEHRCSDLT